MFVKFLESESIARQPAAKLPAAAMVNDTQLRMNQRKTAAKGKLTTRNLSHTEANNNAFVIVSFCICQRLATFF